MNALLYTCISFALPSAQTNLLVLSRILLETAGCLQGHRDFVLNAAIRILQIERICKDLSILNIFLSEDNPALHFKV